MRDAPGLLDQFVTCWLGGTCGTLAGGVQKVEELLVANVCFPLRNITSSGLSSKSSVCPLTIKWGRGPCPAASASPGASLETQMPQVFPMLPWSGEPRSP